MSIPELLKILKRKFILKIITSFEDFIIVINKLLQNHELPECVLRSYYELCCSQSAFLHANLFKGIYIANAGTAASILSRTVNIANALRTCKLYTFLDEFALWHITLIPYEALGMNVRFLCTRLDHLQSFAFSSQGVMERRSYIEASYECVRCRGQVRKLEAILVELRNISIKLDVKVESLDQNAAPERYIETCSQLVGANDEVRKLESLFEELTLVFDMYDCDLEEVSAPW